MTITGWMDKQIVTNPYKGALFSYKKESSADTYYNMDRPCKYFVKRNDPDTKGHIFCDCIYIKLS